MIYSHLAASFGWTWDYIDKEMTLPRLYEINRYFENHPPVHILLAAFMGVKQKPTMKKEEDLDAMIAELSQAGLSVL